MAQKPQMQAPSGMAGIVRYHEEGKSLVKLKPEHIVILCTGIAAVEVLLLLFL